MLLLAPGLGKKIHPHTVTNHNGTGNFLPRGVSGLGCYKMGCHRIVSFVSQRGIMLQQTKGKQEEGKSHANCFSPQTNDAIGKYLPKQITTEIGKG